MAKNLQEYNKVISVINSAKNPDHFDVCYNMTQTFAQNCDFRQNKLYKIAWKKMLGLTMSGWRDYYSYKKTTLLQIDHIINLCNMWNEQYDMWLEEQKMEDEKKELDKLKKITIKGFSSYFKLKKKNGRTKT